VIKRVTFVRRASTAPVETFAAQWRSATLARVESLPPSLRPIRLAHCVVRSGATKPPWDGVAISWHQTTSLESWTNSWAHADSPLDGPGVSVTVEERIVEGGDWLDDRWRDGGAMGFVLIGLIEAADGLSRAAFRDYWWDRHRPLANSLVPVDLAPVAYVHDYVLDDGAVAAGFTWAGIGEMYERSPSTARQRGEWFGSEAAIPLAIDEERFMVRGSRQVLVGDGEVVYRQAAD